MPNCWFSVNIGVSLYPGKRFPIRCYLKSNTLTNISNNKAYQTTLYPTSCHRQCLGWLLRQLSPGSSWIKLNNICHWLYRYASKPSILSSGAHARTVKMRNGYTGANFNIVIRYTMWSLVLSRCSHKRLYSGYWKFWVRFRRAENIIQRKLVKTSSNSNIITCGTMPPVSKKRKYSRMRIHRM